MKEAKRCESKAVINRQAAEHAGKKEGERDAEDSALYQVWHDAGADVEQRQRQRNEEDVMES